MTYHLLPQNLGPQPGLRLSLLLCDGESLPARLDGFLPALRWGPAALSPLSHCGRFSPERERPPDGGHLCAVQAGGSSTHGPEDGVSSACGPSNLQGLRTDHGITCTREGSLGEKRVMKPEHLRGSSRTRHRAFRPEDSSFLSLLGFPPHLPFFLMTSAKLPISPQVLILGNLATASHDYE